MLIYNKKQIYKVSPSLKNNKHTQKNRKRKQISCSWYEQEFGGFSTKSGPPGGLRHWFPAWHTCAQVGITGGHRLPKQVEKLFFHTKKTKTSSVSDTYTICKNYINSQNVEYQPQTHIVICKNDTTQIKTKQSKTKRKKRSQAKEKKKHSEIVTKVWTTKIHSSLSLHNTIMWEYPQEHTYHLQAIRPQA